MRLNLGVFVLKIVLNKQILSNNYFLTIVTQFFNPKMCLEMFSRISCSLPFPGTEVSLTDLQFPGVLLPAFLEDESDTCSLPGLRNLSQLPWTFESKWEWLHNSICQLIQYLWLHPIRTYVCPELWAFLALNMNQISRKGHLCLQRKSVSLVREWHLYRVVASCQPGIFLKNSLI